MADCSRPPHRNQRGLAKNLSGVFGFGSKGVYDDVFAARPKMRAPAFTPGAKDYAEIFNCKQPSSIPVLELEEFEVRSSEVDYGNVFGGLDEGQIGSSYEEVFRGGDGDRRTDDSRAHSRGSDRPTAVEESQKLTHESLRRKERSMSFDDNRGANDETDEINSQAKNSQVPVSTSAFDGTVPLKNTEVSRSGAVMDDFKQCSEEAPVEKHSRNVSSGGLSKHDNDGFIEIDVNSGNRYGSDKSISSNMPVEADIVRSKALISEAIIASNYISHLGSPVATSKELAGSKSDECRSNASKDPYVGLSGSSRDAVEVQNVHGLDKPFESDSAVDESVARLNAVRSEVICSSGLTLDHDGVSATQVLPTVNAGAYNNTNVNENTTDGTFSHSQQDVQFQDVNCLGNSFSKFPVNATAAELQAENSKSILESHYQHNFGEPNTAAEGDLVPETAASRNADSKSTDWDCNGHLTSSVKPKNEAGLDEQISSDMPVDTKVIDLKAHNSKVAPPPSVQSNLDTGVPALKKATTSKSGESRSTYSSVREDHAPSFSDDEIDKNSEAATSAAAIKTAIREAQAWISIAKESNGVKGFMKHVVAKNFRQVKEGKEAINKEKPKLFEPGQTAIGNNCSTSATRKDYVAPWATSLETKTVPGETVEEVYFKETNLCASDRLNQRRGDAVIESSSRKIIETASTLQHATPSISTSEEKLTISNRELKEKLVHRKEDTAIQGVSVDSGLASIVREAKCSEVPNAGKRETDATSTDEAVINKYDDTNTVTKLSNAKESQEPINSDQRFMMHSFQDVFGRCNAGCSANEVKGDLVSGTGHMAVHSKPSEGINAQSGLRIPCFDNSEEDLASMSLKEENEKESELDPHDQVSDYEDTDSQDYASAVENLVSTDTDDEINDKDLNSPAQNQPDDVDNNISMQSMVEATTISEDVSAPCFNNLNEEPIIGETDENEVKPLQNKVIHEKKVTSDEKAVPFPNYSNEDPVIEETDESEDIALQNMETYETKVTPEERTMPVFSYSNEDSMVEETDVIGDPPILNTVTPGARNTLDDGVAPCFDSTNEESRVEETGGIERMTEQNMVIPEADIVSENVVAPYFDSSNEYVIVEEIIADTEELRVSSSNHEHGKAVEDMIEQDTVILIPEANIISEDVIPPCFDNSNEGLMVDEMLVDTTEKAGMSSPNHAHEKEAADSATFCIHEHTTLDKEESENVARVEAESARVSSPNHAQEKGAAESATFCIHEHTTVDKKELENVARVEAESARVSSPNHAHEKGAAESTTFCIHEHATFDEEESENVARVEAESASIAGRASSHPEGPGVELPRRDDVSEDSVSETIKESRSTPWSCEHEKQEVGAATLSDLEPRTQAREELHNVATVESDFIGGFEPTDTRGSENDQVNIDSAKEEEANELESALLYPDHVDLELKAGSRFCEPLPDFIQTEETTNFEHHSESLIQPLERHERKKWEIPKEAFELPEVLKSGISDVHDTLEQDSCELKRQTDKHERKKWEIPRETFKLPVLDAEVVGVIEEKEDQESVTLSGEKPERKKWKIQKEVFEVPTLIAEAVQETSEQEGFVIKTASEEEMRMRDDRFSKLLFSEESDQHGEVQKEFSVDEEVVVPDKGVFPGICDDNSPDHMEKEWMPEIKMLGEEERVNQFNETSDQQETKVEEGEAAGQEECTKGQEDINVKDELKRTLGMLWKKICKSKQDEDLETVNLITEENDTFKDEKGRGVDKDLNLKGPVELVESPRQQDDIEVLNFSDPSSGNEENGKETSSSSQFEANGSQPSNSGDFISTTEVTEDSSSASVPCKLQEDDSRSCTEETCKQYYTANGVESHLEEILSLFGSVGSDETTQIYGNGADKPLKKGSLEKNTPPSDVNECSWVDCEMVSGLKPLLPDESFVANDEDTEKVKSVFQENRTKEDEMLNKTTSTNEACQDVDDEVEALLADHVSDKSDTNSEQLGTSSTRQYSKSVSDDKIADDTSSREFEKVDKIETEPDMVEQASSWNWIFGDELRDKRNKQNKAPDICVLPVPCIEKARTKEAADNINTSLVARKAKTDDDKPSRMEATGNMRKEVSPDQDVLNNIMRAKERERIVVERTIREVRERAFAEARERAARDRANAEAQQKALADDQERSQETSSEAKLAAEKNSLEGKRKAELERAAVERATAEARQRALEKAMSRQEQASLSHGSSSKSADAADHGSSSKDRLTNDKPSESALRFIARNERHQRIAERAAKALAEKNMRDLLVQRDQAERNRLSEVLDADVKRWASGKTNNLRALLSTLQYILGPDSGWKPIHLTEIVTADAVKKAYRKATLFVHPDKLQQRGASIKQKYICEKVFDLLKEAWNKFDRDER